ncbi:MAG: Fur family transcriptional regulator [Thermodesulfobacteriota bacterium]
MRELTREHLDILREACRQAGLRLTQQRLSVFQEILGSADHPTAEVVHRRLRRTAPTLSLDTVYRTLALLERSGLAHRVLDPGGGDRFDPVTDGHAHVVCRSCGRFEDLHEVAPAGEGMPEAKRWGRLERCHVVYHGVCNACLAGAEQAAESGETN